MPVVFGYMCAKILFPWTLSDAACISGSVHDKNDVFRPNVNMGHDMMKVRKGIQQASEALISKSADHM